MTEAAYRIAFSEVIFLINKMQPENRAKISSEFIDFLDRNKDRYYNIPEDISMEKKELLKRETKIVLSIMYREYFLNKDEKEEKQRKDNEILAQIYSYDNIFKNKKVEPIEKANTDLTIQKTNKFEKIIYKLKKLFFRIIGKK